MRLPYVISEILAAVAEAEAVKIGVPVPNTVILPSKDMPDDTTGQSFRNLAYPLDWEGIFNYVGFPAYMKPFDGGGWKEVYKLHHKDEFFEKYDLTKQYVMMLQEEVTFKSTQKPELTFRSA